MPIYLCDSHTHLDQHSPAEIPGILQRASEAGVGLIICAGTTQASSRTCVEMAENHDMLLAGVGVHPMDVKGLMDEAAYDSLKALALSSPKVVCISEIGLDLLPSSPDREIQYQAFREQIRLARELSLPIICHSRESYPEVMRTLREEKAYEVGGVMHYFQGDEATAREAMEMGFFISLSKVLLRLPELQELVKKLPLESIVLETDAAPQPWKKYRHNWTEPYHVKIVAEKLAELKGITFEEVAEATTKNVSKILKRN